MKAERELLTAHVASGNTIFIADVLRVGTELWLVPKWYESPDGKWRTPALAIRVDLLPHQIPGVYGADLTLNSTIPKDVLNGLTALSEGVQYEVETGPSDRLGQIPVRQGN